MVPIPARSERTMLDVTFAGWALTVGLVVVLLAVDLALAITRPHEVGFREAVSWSLFYVAVRRLAAFSFMFLLFGLLLVGTAIQLYRQRIRSSSRPRSPSPRQTSGTWSR